MEGEVFLDAVAPFGGAAVDRPQRPAQRRDLQSRRPLGGQRRGLGLERAAHLAHLHHVVDRGDQAEVELERRHRRRRGDVDARTLARAQQAARLELVHRLAHDGARDAVRVGEALLGRQAVAGAQPPGVDLVDRGGRRAGRRAARRRGARRRPHGPGGRGSAWWSGHHTNRPVHRSTGLPSWRRGCGGADTSRQPGRGSRPHASANGQRHDPVSTQELRRDGGPARRRHRHRRRLVHRARRPFGLRQVDPAAHDRRPRGDQRRRDPHRREACQRRAAERARHRDGVPELRALSAHDGARRTSPSR